ncbi:unnamed protein product [Mytilus coruscus]|uniref:Fucolectin tachylectin-4 pentraxin-1 domain-containing protein n=1 Tax=Mytilus coruscus TaxID=42192 RepID=A0A6J8DJU5_MYTCO|nr:unnamed protein product [Mytilus coruscus]
MYTADTFEVAKNKPTKQSSNAHPFYRHSQKAVNGEYSESMSLSIEFCSETSDESEPSWWAVDLGAIYDISNVVIFGRNDCCDERLSNFSIEVIRPCRNNSNWFEDSVIEVCYFQQAPTTILNAPCRKRIFGQYVRIRLSNPNYLALCEVEVHGTFIGFLHTVGFPYACGFRGHSYDGHNETLSSAIVYSDIHCTYICSYMKECHVADFNKKTSVCTLMKKKTGSNVVTNSDHNVFLVY